MSARQIHNLSADEVYAVLHSRPEGLTPAQAKARLDEFGPNALKVAGGFHWTTSLLRQATNFFSLLLDVSAGLCFVADHIQPGQSMAVLGWALLGVSILNSVFAFAQEYRAERIMEALRTFLPQLVRVRRDGCETEIPSEDATAWQALRRSPQGSESLDRTPVHDVDVRIRSGSLKFCRCCGYVRR